MLMSVHVLLEVLLNRLPHQLLYCDYDGLSLLLNLHCLICDDDDDREEEEEEGEKEEEAEEEEAEEEEAEKGKEAKEEEGGGRGRRKTNNRIFANTHTSDVFIATHPPSSQPGKEWFQVRAQQTPPPV